MERLLGAEGFQICELEFVVAFDPRTRTPRPLARPLSLFAAVWMRIVEVLTSDTVLRRCMNCNRLFTAGGGTDRRLDSDQHRILYHRQKRAPACAGPAAAVRPAAQKQRPRPAELIAVISSALLDTEVAW